MFLPSFTVTPAITGYVNATEFVFTNTTQTTATLQKLVWDLGDGSSLIYDTDTVQHTFLYPGVYTVRLSATDSEDNFDTYIENITVDLLYRDYVVYTQIPENYSIPGKKTDVPFRVRVVSSSISATELNLDLYVINSKSIPEQFVSPRWTFLNPTWKFLDVNDNTIYSLNVPVTPIYYNDKVVAVSGEEEFYFVDSRSAGNPETECPLLVTCTLQTSSFVNSKDSLIYPYKSYANNTTVKCATIWHVHNYQPDLLRITSNYLDETRPDYWDSIKIPFIVTAHACRDLKVPGADKTVSEIIFSYPQVNDDINGRSIVNVGFMNCESSACFTDEGPLYFQATDNFDTMTGGYIFTTVTPKTTAFQTALSATTLISEQINYVNNRFPDIHTLAPNGFVWVANPTRGALNKIIFIPSPENCPAVESFKQDQVLIDGSIRQTQVSVPLTENNQTFNYYLTGFSGIYGLAIDPRHYELIAADADLGCLFKFSTTGSLLSTLALSTVDNKDSVKESSAPASISLDQDYNIWVSLFNSVSVLKYDKDFNLLFSTAPTGNISFFYEPTSTIISNTVTNIISTVTVLTGDIDLFLQNLPSITPTLSTNVVYLTSTFDNFNTYIVNYSVLFNDQPLSVNSKQVSSSDIKTFIESLSTFIQPTYNIRYNTPELSTTSEISSATIEFTTLYQTEPLSTNFINNLSTITPLFSAYFLENNNSLTYTVQYNSFTMPGYGTFEEDTFVLFVNPLTSVKVLATNLQNFIQNLNTVSPFPYDYSYYKNDDETLTVYLTVLSSFEEPILNDIFDGDNLLKPPVVETDQNSDCWCTYAHPLCSLIVKYSPDGVPKTQIVLPSYSVPVGLAIAANNDVWVSNSYNVLSAPGNIQRYTEQPTRTLYLSTGVNISVDLSATYVEGLSTLPDYFDTPWLFTQFYGTSTEGFSAVDISFAREKITLPGEYTLITSLTGIPRPGYLAVDRYNKLWFTYGLRNLGCYDPDTQSLYKWFIRTTVHDPFELLEAPFLSASEQVLQLSLETLTALETDTEPQALPFDTYNYDVYTNDEELGGLGVDVYNRIWIIDSITNRAFVIYQHDLSGPTLKTRAFKVRPDTTIGYWPDFVTGATITDNLTGVKSAQAAGDWTGYKWYQKYITPDNYPSTKVITGSSMPFNINPFKNPYQFRKINDSFNTSEYYKNLALPENLQTYTTLWDKFFPALVGTGEEKILEDIGQTSYEKIANFSQNHRDIDTCNISQLLSLAEETNVRYSDFATRLPADILKTMDLLSISLSRLFGQKNNYPNLLLSLSSEIISTPQNIILRNISNSLSSTIIQNLTSTPGYVPNTWFIINPTLSTIDITYTYYNTVSSGQKIILKSKYNESISLVNLPPILNTTVYSVSNLELPGYAKPISKHYQLFEYNPQYEDFFIENTIDWTSPHTTLSPNLSTVDEWYQTDGIAETTFNYLLNKNLFYK
jgi:hypothetical protein